MEVKAGDALHLTDMEGGQVCEVGLCDAAGRFDAAALAVRADGRGEGLKAVLAEDSETARRSRAALKRRGIELGAAQTFRIVGETSIPGATAGCRVSLDCVLNREAPGADLSPDTKDICHGI